jgi:hypothetical protein
MHALRGFQNVGQLNNGLFLFEHAVIVYARDFDFFPFFCTINE